jgi:hypothetical protein
MAGPRRGSSNDSARWFERARRATFDANYAGTPASHARAAKAHTKAIHAAREMGDDTAEHYHTREHATHTARAAGGQAHHGQDLPVKTGDRGGTFHLTASGKRDYHKD